jgi:hypothetical protein
MATDTGQTWGTLLNEIRSKLGCYIQYGSYIREPVMGELDSFEEVELTSEGRRVWWDSRYMGSASNITTSSSESRLGKGINFNCFAFWGNFIRCRKVDAQEVSEQTFCATSSESTSNFLFTAIAYMI